MVAQLGMTGQLTVQPEDGPIKPHTHLRWPLKNTGRELRYVDPRRFGLIDVCDEGVKKAILGRLGPDPFVMTPKDYPPLISVMKRSNRVIKDVLLDQSVIAGVGNIYASEALFLAQIDPRQRAMTIDDRKYDELIAAIVSVLQTAFRHSGTSFSSYVDGSGKKGENLAFLKVFQRDGMLCFLCNSLILRIKQAGRSTFFCPVCQR